MEWLFAIVIGFFGFGVGRAIKLYHINRDMREYSQNLKMPVLGLAVTCFIGGLLYKFADISAPIDNCVTWLILVGPLLLAFLADEDTLRLGQ